MTTIVTRAGKGSALTFTEADANFTNLKNTADDHIADTAGAHAGTAISNTPAGNIVATTVQAAIDELDGQDTTIQTNLNTRTGTSASTMFRNRLVNGDFKVAQRGTSFTSTTTPANNDDTYLLDRWTLLSDTNDVVDVTQTSTVPTAPGALTSIGLDCETINKKFGIIQFIENKDCADLIGNTVTLSFKMKVSSTTKFDNIKAAILTWSSTADSLTSDVISAWGVEGTNPTLVANWTYENTPANLNPTTSWATYSVSGLVDTASAANIAVFIWSDVTDTTLTDFIYITDVQLEAGTVATPFERKSYATEYHDCLWTFQRLSDIVGSSIPGTLAVKNQTTNWQAYLPFARQMRIAPALTNNNITAYVNSAPGAGQVGIFSYASSAYDTITGALTLAISPTGFRAGCNMTFTAGTSFAAATGTTGTVNFHSGWTAGLTADL